MPPHVTLDFTIANSTLTDFTGRADDTVYVSGTARIVGTLTLEGGCVVKLTNSPSATIIASNIVCKTGPYRPAWITSKDLDTAGETIPGSSGNPNGYYGGIALDLSGASHPVVSGLRFSYLSNSLAGTDITIQHAQFDRCYRGLASGISRPTLRNVLVHRVNTFVAAADGLPGDTVIGEHITAHFVTNFVGDATSTVRYTNCLFVCATNWSAYSTATNASVSLNSDAGIFQTVGGASHYLADFSPYRGIGTTNVNAALYRSLADKTTYPPLVYSNQFLSGNMTLLPRTQRTGAAPDLGYAYDPLDYVFGACYWTNGTITITPGTAIGTFAIPSPSWAYGIGLAQGARFVAEGSPIDPVRIVRYNTVQEESTTNWAAGVGPSLQSSWVSTLPVPEIRCRFTQFSSLAQDAAHLYAPEGNATPLPFNFRDCQFHSGLLGSVYPTINLTNCLLERVRTEIWTGDSNVPNLRNNTIIGGTFDYLPASSPNAVIQDNLFDGALGLPDLTGWGYDGAYNAYVTNATNITFRIYPTKATDLILTSSPNYQAGPLGNYYHPTNSALINRDTATAASSVGLYHYTLSTNFSGGFQIRETNSWLDTGYHYVAVNTNGVPIDTDGGGAPDWLEDVNGDGSANGDPTDWTAGHGNDDSYYQLIPGYLRCEYRVDPWGVYAVDPWTGKQKPRFFWIVTSPRRAQKQVAYQILVATTTNNLNINYGDMWNSGKVFSDDTIHVEYNGKDLQSGQRLWWKVRSWDLYSGASTWSTNAFFQMGLLSTEDWGNARWISVNGYDEYKPCPMFRSLPLVLSNQVASATAYVSAKGVYELWINGQKIGPNILAPEWTDYNHRIQYQTFDVGPYLNSGTATSSNIIGAFVGEGWCYGDTDYGSSSLASIGATSTNTSQAMIRGNGESSLLTSGGYYGTPDPAFLLRLVVKTNDSDNALVFITDTNNWRCSTNGLIRFASIYRGETDDARQEGYSAAWTTPSHVPQTFTAPVKQSNVGTNLFSQPNEPIQIVTYRNPINMWTNTRPSDGQFVTIFDMGQNMVGWCNLSITNTNGMYGAGSNVVVRHAEALQLNSNNNGAFGPNLTNIYVGNLETPPNQVDTFVLNGETNQQFRPHFTYHGFRYVEIAAPAAIAAKLGLNSVTGCVIRSGVPITGAFSCYGTNASSPAANWVLSNKLINKLMTNAFWGLQGNLQGVFTACTQRSERDGYLFDEHIFSQTACFQVDMAAFLTKWIRDIREAQSVRMSLTSGWPYGGYTVIAPWDDNPILGDITYSDPGAQAGGLIFPWRLYQNYGDTRVLAEHYRSATNHIAYLTNLCNSGGGDWRTAQGLPPTHPWSYVTAKVQDWASGDYFAWFGLDYSNPYAWPAGYGGIQIWRTWGTGWSAYCVDLAADMAQALRFSAQSRGDAFSAASYASDYSYFTNVAGSKIRPAFVRDLAQTNASGQVTGIWSSAQGTYSTVQSDLMTALHFNLISDDKRSNIVWILVNGSHGITNYNVGYTNDGSKSIVCTNHLSSGYYFASREMLELTRDGYTSKAYELLMDTNFPSWLYPVVVGSTTCWEGWNTYLPGPPQSSGIWRGLRHVQIQRATLIQIQCSSPQTVWNCL